MPPRRHQRRQQPPPSGASLDAIEEINEYYRTLDLSDYDDEDESYDGDEQSKDLSDDDSYYGRSFLRFKYFRNMGLTENDSATYLTSGNPCLDFFFHVVPDSSPEKIAKRLKKAWRHDPLMTLKLVCNLRGVRGTGKSDKESFYAAALWLYENHPMTLAGNVGVIAEFGYFKDLLEVLFRVLEGPEVRKKRKREWSGRKGVSRKGIARKRYFLDKKKERKAEKAKKSDVRATLSREERVAANLAQMVAEKEKARALRKEREEEMRKRALEKYDSDEKYMLLHDEVSTLFAYMLKYDIDSLNSGNVGNISLAAKWCPTIDSAYDKATLICESIARKIFPRESDNEFESMDEARYVLRVKDQLRKNILVPLHQALKLPEVYMSARQWKSLEYDRVASVAMKNYTDIFLRRDKEGFMKYLEKVKIGDAKIAAGALLPHDIVGALEKGSGASIVAELQWNRMVDDLLKKGKLTNCLAVCDVSGSMNGTPMKVSVALGLLVSELSEEPWKGHVITFSQLPQLHLIKGTSLKSKTEFIRKMDWGMNTDFQKVFDRILEVAVNGKLSEDSMVKRVFVFSDMEFDQASANPWETDYDVIQKKFKASGYEKVPDIVFWNLRDSSATPVTATQSGVAMLSGFSKNLLTLFLEEGGLINPEDVPEQGESGTKPTSVAINPESTMLAAISGDLYDKLVVFD